MHLWRFLQSYRSRTTKFVSRFFLFICVSVGRNIVLKKCYHSDRHAAIVQLSYFQSAIFLLAQSHLVHNVVKW